MYVPEGTYRDLVMQECHDARYAGHLGMNKTTKLIQRDFYWPTLGHDVENYVRTCEECQCNKANNQKPSGLLQPLAIPAQRWERVSMDFVTHLPKTRQGYDALLVVVDYVTRHSSCRVYLLQLSTTTVVWVGMKYHCRTKSLQYTRWQSYDCPTDRMRCQTRDENAHRVTAREL